MTNIKEIVDKSNVDFDVIAASLFPDNQYKTKALTRVLEGKAELKMSQALTLSRLIGISIEELYSNGWKSRFESPKHFFKNGDVEAVIDTETWKSEIFVNGKLSSSTVIVNSSIALDDYLKSVIQTLNK